MYSPLTQLWTSDPLTSMLGISTGTGAATAVIHEGPFVGVAVGGLVGAFVGFFVGESVGAFVGESVGVFVGESVGAVVGAVVGTCKAKIVNNHARIFARETETIVPLLG